MNTKTRLILTVALLGVVTTVLVMALTQCGGPPALVAETATPAPTPIPLTEGEKAAAAVGQRYARYIPSAEECSHAVESGEVEKCATLASTQRVVRSEWEQLFPDAHFYVIEFLGRTQDELTDYDRWRELAAWQDDQHYTAETFDRLLKANGVITITDENRELVAKAFALMTIPNYLEEEVVFTEWKEVDSQQARHTYDQCLLAWTRLGGLEVGWCFVFQNERLKIASGPGLQQSRIGLHSC